MVLSNSTRVSSSALPVDCRSVLLLTRSSSTATTARPERVETKIRSMQQQQQLQWQMREYKQQHRSVGTSLTENGTLKALCGSMYVDKDIHTFIRMLMEVVGRAPQWDPDRIWTGVMADSKCDSYTCLSLNRDRCAGSRNFTDTQTRRTRQEKKNVEISVSRGTCRKKQYSTQQSRYSGEISSGSCRTARQFIRAVVFCRARLCARRTFLISGLRSPLAFEITSRKLC